MSKFIIVSEKQYNPATGIIDNIPSIVNLDQIVTVVEYAQNGARLTPDLYAHSFDAKQKSVYTLTIPATYEQLPITTIRLVNGIIETNMRLSEIKKLIEDAK